MNLLATELAVGAIRHGPAGNLLVREGDERLTAALPAEVIQDENGLWLELGVTP